MLLLHLRTEEGFQSQHSQPSALSVITSHRKDFFNKPAQDYTFIE